MIPARAPRPFHRPGWVYEEKIDGYRMLAVKDGSRVLLLSRRGYEMGFPGIVAALAALPAPSLILDGEVAVFDERFVSHLGYLMGRMEPEGVVTLPMLVAFDCLHARGPRPDGRAAARAPRYPRARARPGRAARGHPAAARLERARRVVIPMASAASRPGPGGLIISD
jgi:hypothetical protein